MLFSPLLHTGKISDQSTVHPLSRNIAGCDMFVSGGWLRHCSNWKTAR